MSPFAFLLRPWLLRSLIHFAILIAGVCCVAPGLRAQTPTLDNTEVAEVLLVIGAVQAQRGGQSLPLSRGNSLRVGDSIQTSANGHIHLRFVDGALVSLRPASLLRIQEYRFDKQNPTASVVKFQLDQGVVRAISGQAADLAKDRFRLNTPLAAIGVKGTDFVVEVAPNRINAIVNQGAIILAPFNGQCRAESLGPCATLAARELSAAVRGMALTYSATMASPQLLPLSQLRGSDLLNLPPAQPVSGENTSSNQATRLHQIQSNESLDTGGLLRKLGSSNTLTWGRWGQAVPQDSLTQAFRDAMQGRSVTIGDGYYFLFRQEVGVPNLLALDQGPVQFSLQQGHAHFVDNSNELHVASIKGGQLGINFSTREFVTALQLDTAAAPSQTLQSSGKIDPQSGIFLSNTGPASSGKVAGALSLDTRQAGYLFSLPTVGGQYKGATLWGR